MGREAEGIPPRFYNFPGVAKRFVPLLEFYKVSNLSDLVSEQEKHIARLQAQIKRKEW